MAGKPLRDHWAYLAHLLDRHGIGLVIDVGANVGQYGACLRQVGYRGRIVSFEPVANAHAELVRAAGGDEAWLVAPRAAVGARCGTVEINVSTNSDMSSALGFTTEAERAFDSDCAVARETAPMTTVDDIVLQHAGAGENVFLKSDTQGFELEVLRGAAASLNRIAGLQLEVALHPVYRGQPDWRSIVDHVAPHGFAVHFVIPGYYSRHLDRMMEMDLVFFRS